MTLCLQGIGKHYARALAPALAGIDLELENGQCLAITGPSGAGKSTLVRIAAGLLAADAGSVRIAGEQPWQAGENAAAAFRRRHIGMLFQGGHLLPELDAESNVALPLLLDGAADARERARQRLAAFGLQHLGRQYPAALSGGEVVRIALLRALVAAPQYVFADEPTGSLDPDSAALVAAALRAAADGGAAVLIVTHDRSLCTIADRHLELRAGKLS